MTREFAVGLCFLVVAGCSQSTSSTTSTSRPPASTEATSKMPALSSATHETSAPQDTTSEAPSEALITTTPIGGLPPQTVDSNEKDQTVTEPRPPRSVSLFRDDFSDVSNSRRGISNGTRVLESKPTRQIFAFAPREYKGQLALIISELPDVMGADNQPGVLRVEWKHVPESLDYSGFRYEGRVDAAQRLKVPQIMSVSSTEELRGFKFRAKFKAVNENLGDEAKIKFDLRMEPVEDRVYDNRLDFGTIEASSTWKPFEIDLGDAKNGERFIAAFAKRGTGMCALVFAQPGSIDDFHDGDGILIDDIEVVDERPTEPVADGR